jgi:hypothetical protein
MIIKQGVVAQLVRVHACHAWGREFEPRLPRLKKAVLYRQPFFISKFQIKKTKILIENSSIKR